MLPDMTINKTPANEKKLAQLKQTLGEVLARALRKGFYGTVGVELYVENGTIQRLHARVERVQR